MNTKLVFVEYIYTRYSSHPYVRYEGLWLEAISVLDRGECSASRSFYFIREETTVGTKLSRRLDEPKVLVWSHKVYELFSLTHQFIVKYTYIQGLRYKCI